MQDSAKPPASNIPMGDDRINPFATSYHFDFNAPFVAHARIRSPMRNKDLAAAGDGAYHALSRSPAIATGFFY